jgi:hypothetical protein
VLTVANAISVRRGLKEADEACMLLAAVVNLAHRRALERWLTGPADQDLGLVIADEFRLISAAFAATEPTGQANSTVARFPSRRSAAD